jgi:hypothetical protein
MSLIIPAKIRRILTISIGSIIILGGVFVLFSPQESDSRDISYLESHELIEHGARINASVMSIRKNGTVTIQLKIDSTEHPELLELKFDEVCLLEVNHDAPFVAQDITIISEDDYSKTLHVLFTGIREPITTLSLHVFGLLGKPLPWELRPVTEN